MGRDAWQREMSRRRWQFQSTLPAWGETYFGYGFRGAGVISIHSPRMGRDWTAWKSRNTVRISIHSPRMGRDRPQPPAARPSQDFNPLSPHGERQLSRCLRRKGLRISIHSPRMGRDLLRLWIPWRGRYFNPLSPHGERHFVGDDDVTVKGIFQSTLPAWGETIDALPLAVCRCISIHSPRMGRDLLCQPWPAQASDFNPLSPHGERPRPASRRKRGCNFNPLSPHGERPGAGYHGAGDGGIFQSTLPAWGETSLTLRHGDVVTDFNPLSPHGERPARAPARPDLDAISIHSPRMGRDALLLFVGVPAESHFNPLSPHGERLKNEFLNVLVNHFNPLSPHGERLILFHCAFCVTTFQSTLPAWGETCIEPG